MADTSLKAISNSIGSIANHQEVIDKHVKEIRDAVCGNGILGILTSINNTIETVTKKNLLSKVTGKNVGITDKFNKRLIKSTDSMVSLLGKIYSRLQKIGGKGGDKKLKLKDEKQKGESKLDSLAKSIGIIERLRGIKLKDFILAKTKMKHISNLMMKFKGMFGKFKNKKEMEATVSFANSSIEIVKKLAKSAIFAIPAKIGMKTIERVFLGGKKGTGGLLAIFRKIDRNEKTIKKGKKGVKDILIATGSMFLTMVLLAPMAVLGIPAMLGALAMKGVIWIMSGTFKMLNKAKKNALIGSLVLLIMSASLITFALGLGFMVKAVKDMKWKDFGMMMASIGALGVVLAVLGIPVVAGLVALGSVALLTMGAGLLVFGIGLGKTAEAVKNVSWEDFGKMMGQIGAAGAAMAGLGLLSIPIGFGAGALLLMGGALKKFASALTEWKKLGDIKQSLINIKNAVRETRKVIKGKFDMKAVRQLKKVGKSLLKLYKGVKDWDKFDGTKAAENIGLTITKLQEVMKTQLDKDAVKSYGRVGRVLRRLFRGVKFWEKFDSSSAVSNIDTAIKSLLQTFADNSIDKKAVKSYRSVGRIVRKLYKGLRHWEKFNAKKASRNVSYAIILLKQAFEKDFDSKGVVKTMKTLVEVTNMSSDIIFALRLWDKYKPGSAIENINNSINGLLSAFGMNDDKNDEAKIEKAVTGKNKFWDRIKSGLKSVGNGIAGAVKQVASNAKNAIHNNGVKRTMSTLRDIMGPLGDIRNFLKPWEGNETSGGIDNITHAIKSINKLDIEKASVMIDVFKSFSRIGYAPFDRFTRAVNKFSNSCNNLINALNNFEPLGGESVEANGNGETTSTSGGINIKNTEALAQALANAIKSLPVNVETNMSDVRLVVNGESGRRVIISLDN